MAGSLKFLGSDRMTQNSLDTGVGKKQAAASALPCKAFTVTQPVFSSDKPAMKTTFPLLETSQQTNTAIQSHGHTATQPQGHTARHLHGQTYLQTHRAREPLSDKKNSKEM